ncbi:MAG: ribonuclease R [Chthoniobacterales bacterium]
MPSRKNKPARARQRSKNSPRPSRRSKSERSADFSKKIISLLKKRPLSSQELQESLRLPPAAQSEFAKQLNQMQQRGEITRIRKNRYIVPEVADLFVGTIQIHPGGTAHVLNEEKGGADLFISAENLWTAMHGDRVVARIHDERGRSNRLEGRVIRIEKRANERIVGTLQRTKNFYYVVPDNPRFSQNLYVPKPAAALQAKIGDKVVAKLESWPSRHVNPEGVIEEVLGAAGAPGVDMLAIIRKYRLPEAFSEEILKTAEQVAKPISGQDIAGREDHRRDFVFTIDPDDARDFDDAIQVERLGDGWRVGVHIADVSHYVQPGSVLDKEACERGNSVYLPDRVIPMLPEVLSNGMCSLRPDEDRLAFSVFADIAKNGLIKKSRFTRSIIRSAKRMTYKEAFAILEKPASSELENHVHLAWELSATLRKRRFAKGSLDLDFPETKVRVDELGRTIGIEKVENDISHQLIEELMLLANELVAREMKRKKQPAIYRVHENPDSDRLDEFREFVLTFGLKCGDLNKPEEVRKLLANVRGSAEEAVIKIGLLKSLNRARYDASPLGHYGLAKTDYLHFTSPIRRYADLIVHRSLARFLGYTKKGSDSRKLDEMADHISTTERNAADAEREAVKLKKLEFFQNQLASQKGEVFKARILEVRNFGMFVELPDYIVSGLVHVSSLDDDFYLFDPSRAQFKGRKTKKTYRAGQEVEVIVESVDIFKQQIDFRVV